MKTISLTVALLTGVALSTQAQSPGSARPSPWTITHRGPNTQVWQRTVYEPGPDGKMRSHVRSYTELASGLNHWDSATHTWIPSTDTIIGFPGGAVATNGQTQVIFANNLNTAGAIDVQSSDGKNFKSHVLGLSYYDTATGSNVWIGTIQDCQGVISSNRVVYSDAFSGLSADVVYQYRRSGFSQDIVLHKRPPLPEVYGLNTATTVLQVWTEFGSAPSPHVRNIPANRTGTGLPDQFLDFGAIKIGQGRAIMLGQDELQGVPISKEWVHLQGLTCLVEQVPIPGIAPQLDKLPLPKQHASLDTRPGSVLHKVSGKRLLPTPKLATRSKAVMKLAEGRAPKTGVLLDYVSEDGNVTNLTFRGNTTYFISGYANLYGTTTFEGGTVLKYTNNATMQFFGPVNCDTGPYRPAVLTAMDDNSVGQTISGSSSPPSGYYANYALYFEGPNAPIHLHDLRILYASYAVLCAYNSQTNTEVLEDSQVGHTQHVFFGYYGGAWELNNLLIYDVSSAVFQNSAGTIGAAQLTIDQANQILSSGTLALTNSLLVSVTNWTGSAFTSVNNVTNASGTAVFQTVGGGHYYLADDSSYRNEGTTNIAPDLLADLATKTTYPPIAYTNVVFTTAQTFSPQAQRDTDVPDLGYHYDPLDYTFGGCTADSNLTFTAGTADGWFRTTSGWYHAGQAIRMNGDITVSFEGTATSPTYWVRLNTVQEQDETAGYGHGSIENWADPPTPAVRGRFLKCTAMAGENFNGYFADDYGAIRAELTHCEFWSGALGTYGDYMYYTNCLMHRVHMGLWGGSSTSARTLRNCTFIGGTFNLSRNSSGPSPVSVRDCAFDGTTISTADAWSNTPSLSDYDYNAYTNSTDPFSIGGANDVKGTTFNWLMGPCGNYYQPTNSPLIDKGDVTADQVGLYHFTVTTNLEDYAKYWYPSGYAEVPEGTSTVDIGYHYVACGQYGNPLDTDRDGIPDYLEDLNGNGIVDSGETDWQNPTDQGLKVWITRPKNNSVLP